MLYNRNMWYNTHILHNMTQPSRCSKLRLSLQTEEMQIQIGDIGDEEYAMPEATTPCAWFAVDSCQRELAYY
jgi:hypothetical protein